MKVKIEGREISIEFRYGLNGYRRECTTCLLRDESAASEERGAHDEAPVIARGTVVRYFRDVPNRDLARKAALAKALANLDEVLRHHDEAVSPRGHKEVRKLFWQAYLNRKGASGKPVPQAPEASTASQDGGQ